MGTRLHGARWPHGARAGGGLRAGRHTRGRLTARRASPPLGPLGPLGPLAERQRRGGLELLAAAAASRSPRAAARRQADEHALQLGDVARDDHQHRVDLAGHLVGRDHLRQRVHGLLEASVGGLVVPGERDHHVDLQREAGGRLSSRAVTPRTTPDSFSRRTG